MALRDSDDWSEAEVARYAALLELCAGYGEAIAQKFCEGDYIAMALFTVVLFQAVKSWHER